MTSTTSTLIPPPLRHADRFFIGGEWVAPSSDAMFDVIDAATEELFFRVAEAQAADIERAVAAARAGVRPRALAAHDPRRAGGVHPRARRGGAGAHDDLGQIWPRESGVLHVLAKAAGIDGDGRSSSTPSWPTPSRSRSSGSRRAGGDFGLLVREPVGVVGAIIPWNAPMLADRHKVAPALLAGCTVIAQVVAGGAGRGVRHRRGRRGRSGCPPGVINVVTADREVSELLVRRPRRRQDHVHRDRRPPGVGSRRSAVSGSLAARWSSAASRRRSSSTTPISAARPRRISARRVLPHRAGLLVAHADRRHPQPSRRARRRAGEHVLAGARRRPVRLPVRRWAARRWSASATGSRATSRRAWPRARSSRPAAGARRTSTAAGTSSPRSSPTSTTPRPSPRRRSSGRC